MKKNVLGLALFCALFAAVALAAVPPSGPVYLEGSAGRVLGHVDNGFFTSCEGNQFRLSDYPGLTLTPARGVACGGGASVDSALDADGGESQAGADKKNDKSLMDRILAEFRNKHRRGGGSGGQ